MICQQDWATLSAGRRDSASRVGQAATGSPIQQLTSFQVAAKVAPLCGAAVLVVAGPNKISSNVGTVSVRAQSR
jgi:hypothetical protein